MIYLRENTAKIRRKYSENTAKIQQKYSKNTAKIQRKYSENTAKMAIKTVRSADFRFCVPPVQESVPGNVKGGRDSHEY